MFNLKLYLVLIAIVFPALITSAQKQIGTYENILTGIALDQSGIMYKEEPIIDVFFRFVFVSSDNKIIITNNQFDERITIDYTRAKNVGEKYFYFSDDAVLMVDLSEGHVVYCEANEKLILTANIDMKMTVALMETIQKME